MYQAPPLHQAVHRANFAEIQRLIEGNDPDVNFQRRTGNSALAMLNEYYREETPLHIACKHGYDGIASYLLASGSDVDGRTGTSPLHLAAEHGNLEVVNLLLQCGADINRRSVNGATPLWRAATMGHTPIVLRLAEVGANVNNNARAEERRLTPLQTASNEGHLGVVEILISADCELDVKDSFGRTALHYASDMGYSDIVKCLLTVGANPNIVDQQGHYPVHAATCMKNLDTIQILAAHGQNLSVGSHSFTGTALHLAVTLQNPESAQALIEVGSDLEEVDSSKYSPLYLAANTAPLDINTWYDIIIMLIQGGSDLDYVFPITHSLLEANIRKRLWPFVALLLDADCKIPPDVNRYVGNCPPDICQVIDDKVHQPQCLRLLCRTVIRQFIRKKKLWPLAGTVNQLPLPVFIKNYIKMAHLAITYNN